MSFVVGFVKPIKFEGHDPTALDTVLEALQSSSKGQLPYPEPLLGIDPTNDVCDSKYIGDLCHITASVDFRNEVSFCDSYDFSNAAIFCDDGEDWNSEYNRLDSCTSIKEAVEEPYTELDAVEGDCRDHLDALTSGPEWTSYRSSGRSPIKSPERGPGRIVPLEDEAPYDGGEVTGWANEDNFDSHHNVESLLSRLQIDKSLPAVLARVKQYQAAYVDRVAAIHARTVAELERCRQQQREEEMDRQQQERQHEQQLQAVISRHTEKLIASRAEEAEQRKVDLLVELAEQQEQEAARQHQEEEELLQKQQEQEALQQQNAAESARLEQQNAGADLLAGLKDSYENFSSALDQVLREIRERGDVELPSDTTTELNSTLQQSSQLLAEADTEQDHDLLQQTTSRLERGITVLHRIKGAIETHKAVTGEASQAHSSEGDATLSSGDVGGFLHSLAGDHPDAATSLAQARDTFNKLAEVHQSVSAISQSVVSEQSELRSQLARALSIVNQFNNDSATSNRQKLHQLVNLVSGGPCDAGGVQVSLGSDKQGPGAMFVREQLASRLISLAHDKQVNSQAVYASLMLRLWQVDPLVQHLCLYHLYKTCPYLVPYLPLREEYGSEEEYHRALGYRHKDGGEREALDSYIKRMGAAGQLYGRLVSLQLEQSPLGLHHAWQLVSRLLVSPAQSAVTCSVLHGLLSTAGAMMAKVYGHQFQKVMALIAGRFLPLLEEATREGGEADLASLKALLGAYFSSRSLPAPPEGYRPLL